MGLAMEARLNAFAITFGARFPKAENYRIHR